MSSILKALKKLENEYPSSGYDQPWLKDIDEKETFFDRLKGSLTTYRQRYVISAAVLLAFAVSAAIIFKADYFKKSAAPLLPEKQQTDAVIPAPSLQSKAQTPSSSTPGGNIKRTENQILPSSQPAKKTNEVIRSTKPAKALRPAVKTSAVSLRQPAKPQAAIETSKSLSSFHPDRGAQPAADASTPIISELSKPDGTLNAKMLNNANMKLQAISWSENSEKRLAVINDSIVHQGDRAGSYIVIRINTDDVILRQDKEMWILPFRPR